jgi:hypothetical protein
MKFIKRLFGKKQEKEETPPLVFDFSEITNLIKTEIKKQEDLSRPFVKERFEEIQRALKELDVCKKELLAADPIEGASKRGEKLGDSNRDNVVNNLKIIHEKLKVPADTTPESAFEFYTDAKSTLKTVLDNTRRSLLYIKALYPQEHKNINHGLSDLEDILDELYLSIEEVNERIGELGKISEEVNNVRKLQTEIKDSNQKMMELNQKYENGKSELAIFDSKLTELDHSKEFEKAKQLETQIKLLDTKIADVGSEARRSFTPLSKAISRMEKQDENERCVLSPENRRIIKMIAEEPASAIEYDLNTFLWQLSERIKSGELGLKEQMCDKALKQIQALQNNKNLSLLAEQKQAYHSQREALYQELSVLSIYKEREGIERKIENHQSLLRSVSSDIESERKRQDSLMEELEMTRSVLQSDIRHVFGEDADIRYPNDFL